MTYEGRLTKGGKTREKRDYHAVVDWDCVRSSLESDRARTGSTVNALSALASSAFSVGVRDRLRVSELGALRGQARFRFRNSE